ncbi:MAG: hypothetical protein NVS3B12_11020 [Acidimicrobiales bacterium]
MVDRSSTGPTHGWTTLGQAVHARTLDHMPTHNAYARFNKWLAIKVTTGVGSMTCAYIFSLLALISLPAILSAFKVFHNTFPDWLVKASLIALVSWIAQTYIQLVLLSVIIVGQNIQSAASDARATKTFEDTEIIVDRLDVHTDGGLKILLDRLDGIEARLPAAN